MSGVGFHPAAFLHACTHHDAWVSVGTLGAFTRNLLLFKGVFTSLFLHDWRALTTCMNTQCSQTFMNAYIYLFQTRYLIDLRAIRAPFEFGNARQERIALHECRQQTIIHFYRPRRFVLYYLPLRNTTHVFCPPIVSIAATLHWVYICVVIPVLACGVLAFVCKLRV